MKKTLLIFFYCFIFSFLLQAATTSLTICLGDNAVLAISGDINDYVGAEWLPTADLTNTNTLTPTFTPTATGDYTFSFTAKNIGAGLFPNGDFESGNTGFTSGYALATPDGDHTLFPEGVYTITDMPNSVHVNSPCNTVSERGYMMAVNGGNTPSTIVWRPAVPIDVDPDTDYAFSAWVMRWTPNDPARLQFQINGQNLGAVQIPPANTCEWGQVYVTWNSGTSTIADITLLNMQTSPGGNDFAIDDVSFALSNDVTHTFHIKVIDCESTENLTMCLAEEPITLNAGDADIYTNIQWLPTTGLSSASSSCPVFTPTSTGLQTYIFTGKNEQGLTITKTFNIDVKPSPVIIAARPTGRVLQIVTDPNAGGSQPFTYLINDKDYYTKPIIGDLSIGTHSLVVINAEGCRSREIAFTIEEADIIPARLFTPNDDTTNDKWTIKGIDFYKDAVVEIYDRTGKLLLKKEGGFKGWDGRYNGRSMPSTDYWYIITIDEINKKLTGHFTLKR